jgi:hypothetical protein
MLRKALVVLFLFLVFLLPIVHGFWPVPQEVILQGHDGEFPSVSAPSLAVLPNGSLLAVFTNMSADAAGEIFGKVSNDNGTSWTEAFLIKSSSAARPSKVSFGLYEALTNFLLVDGSKVFLFYSRFVNDSDLSLWKLESFDNGQTWTNDVRVDNGNHNYVCTGTNGLRMRNGTLIVPIAWDGNASILRSDNDGLNWTEGEPMHISDSWRTTLDEPAIVELSNGSLYCLLRTEYNPPKEDNRYQQRYNQDYNPNANFNLSYEVHFYSVSNNYGLNWSLCLPVRGMFSFNTTPALLRYSWNPNIVVAVWMNRTSISINEGTYYRRPLLATYSLDDCNTWKGTTIIDNGSEKYSFNEPNIALYGDSILVGYRRYLDSDYAYASANNTELSSDSLLRKFPIITLADANSIIEAFGSKLGDSNWNPIVDLNGDGIVNILDAIFLAK